MTDPIKGGGSKPPIKQTESTSESTSKDAKVQKDSTPQETQDPKKLAKAKGELASTKKFDMQLQDMSQKLASELPKTPGKVLDQKTNVAEPACTGTLLSTCNVPDTKPNVCDTLSGCTKPGTDLSSLPGRTPGTILDQKTNVAEPACTGTLLSTCNVPDTKELCDTLSGCKRGTDLGSLPGRTPGTILDQKTNVAEPACTGTLLSTCNVPDTKPNVCDTLSGCTKPGTDLRSVPGRTPGTILDQKTNAAEPACTGTLLSTCSNSSDTCPGYCDTLSAPCG
jgi:hypothetical protein